MVDKNWKALLSGIQEILLNPMLLLLVGVIFSRVIRIYPLYDLLTWTYRIKLSTALLVLTNFISGTWVTFNIFHSAQQQVKQWSRNELLLIFSLPLIEYVEGLMCLAKIHMIIPTLYKLTITTLAYEKVAQAAVVLVVMRLVYVTFYQLNKYLSQVFLNNRNRNLNVK